MTLKTSSYTKIGALVLTTIVLFIWGLNYLKGINFFKPENTYYVEYEKVDGLESSADVLINGFKVGQVRNISFKNNLPGNLIVVFTLKKEIKIPENSIANIFSSDLMGTKSIDLLLSTDSSFYATGDTLIGSIEGGLKEQVSLQMLPLKTKAEDLMLEIEKAIVTVQSVFNEKTIDNLIKSIESIKFTIKNLETASYSIDTLVESEKVKLANIFTNIESITGNLRANNASLANAMKNFSDISDSIAQSNLKSAINSAAIAIANVDSITAKINSGQGSLSLLLNNDTLYYNLEDAAYNLDRLVEDLRVNPKRYVHFSVFDLGKTVYTDASDVKAKRTIKTQYKVQILESNKPIAINPENFKGLKNVEEFIEEGTYQYMIGSKKTLEKATELLNEISELYPDSFIILFKEGEKISLK